jgi:hypothetical protein
LVDPARVAHPQNKPRVERNVTYGPAIADVVDTLLALPLRSRLREAQAIVRLADTYAARMEAACARARDAGDGRYRTMHGILTRRLDLAALDAPPVPQPVGAFLRGPAAFVAAADEVAAW